jgi:serine/threonine protein kinase
MMHLPRSLKRLLDLPDAGRRLGPFVLVAPLGRGGFAPVWLARETYGATELRTAAVKLFSLDTPEGSASGPAALHRAKVIDEARALCRVEHPNIVRFYALPTDEARGLMGLAMEHVAGTPLDQRIAEAGTLPVGETVAVGAAVASALAAVHRAGLVHRDVKPANIVEAGGVYKLIDFGIAAMEERSQALAGQERSQALAGQERRHVVAYDDLPIEVPDIGPRAAGTFGYVDPESVARGASATPASDLYALGATLFECLTGKLPCAAGDRPGTDRSIVEGRKRAPALLELLPDAPPDLARIVDALLLPTRSDRPASASVISLELERLRIALSRLDRALPPEDVGPFRGLGRFEEGDRDVYFGRAGELAAALDQLRSLGVVALVGASGSGKSSLARAGVLPRVAEGGLGGWPKRWDTAIVTPGNDARAAIAAALKTIDPPLADAEARTPEAVVEALAKRAESTERGLVLLVDQLEELATLGSGPEVEWVVELLGSLGERALPGVRAVVTVRRDLLDPLLGLGKLGKALVRGSLLVAPMSDAVWGDVVEQALLTYGYTLEDAALREVLIGEMALTAGSMPLVQFALTELWRKRDRGRKMITRESLSAIGGIAGALERHADATLERIERDHAGGLFSVRDVLLSLTTPQGTRAHKTLADLERAGGALGREVIAALEAARLVAREPDGVTLAHDALVTQWGKLRAWVAEARADRLLVEELERDAERWCADDSAPLWKGRRLDAAEDVLRLRAVDASPEADEFVRAGRRAERRGRLVAGGSALGAVSFAVLGVVLYVRDVGAQRVEADRARTEAEANLDAANEQRRENDRLLQKLRDAEDANALRRVQEEARKTSPSPPAGPRPPAPPREPALTGPRATPVAPAPTPAAAPSSKRTAQPGGGFF